MCVLPPYDLAVLFLILNHKNKFLSKIDMECPSVYLLLLWSMNKTVLSSGFSE